METTDSSSKTELTASGEPWKPRDGGLKAWLVALASFLNGGILFGIINSYSVIYVELLKHMEENEVADASYKASLVGSLSIGVVFALSPVAGILTDLLGIRVTSVLGGVIAALGMLLSSFLTDWVEALYFTYGILFGLGASLAYTPSLSILGLHFRRHMGLVNGLVTTGSSVFTVVIPPILGVIIPWAGLPGVLRFLAGCMLCISAVAMLYTVPEGAIPPRQNSSNGRCLMKCSDVINVEVFKKKRYLIWGAAIFSSLFGYFVPYVHIKKLSSLEFPERDGSLLVMCIGVTSGLGRLLFGKVSDLPRVDRIVLQQISFVSIGVLTMLVTAAPNFWYLVAIALAMGLFDGCFISLLGPIAFDLCGTKNGAQAIGFLFGTLAVPLTLGPPIAGMLFDRTQSYYLPFLLAGCPPILGGLAMFAVRCVPPDHVTKEGVEDGDLDARDSTPEKVAVDDQYFLSYNLKTTQPVIMAYDEKSKI